MRESAIGALDGNTEGGEANERNIEASIGAADGSIGEGPTGAADGDAETGAVGAAHDGAATAGAPASRRPAATDGCAPEGVGRVGVAASPDSMWPDPPLVSPRAAVTTSARSPPGCATAAAAHGAVGGADGGAPKRKTPSTVGAIAAGCGRD